MIRQPPRSTHSGTSAASDVYQRQVHVHVHVLAFVHAHVHVTCNVNVHVHVHVHLHLLHDSDPTRLGMVSFAVLC